MSTPKSQGRRVPEGPDSQQAYRGVADRVTMPPLIRYLLWGQGIYFLLTGIWPLAHIDSVQRITGPKTDLWLVKAVGVLVGAIGLALIVAALRRRVTAELWLIAVLSALGLAVVDIWYVAERWILPVYLGDAAAEIALIVLWLILLPRARRTTCW